MISKAELIRELETLNKQITACETALKKMPSASFFISHNNNCNKWYSTKNGVTTYIPKQQKSYAEKLALSKYLKLKLSESRDQRSKLQNYIKSLADSKSGAMLSDPAYTELLASYYKPRSEELAAWAAAQYDSNPSHPESLAYPSSSGHTLRSKSEVIIDMALSMHRLPFRYESSLIIGGRIFYPDFTVRHPETGDTFYWEHFGMMDNTDYIDDCTSKLRFYAKNGIISSVNLITTWETSGHPLSPQLVEEIIRYYFVSA